MLHPNQTNMQSKNQEQRFVSLNIMIRMEFHNFDIVIMYHCFIISSEQAK